MNAPVFLTLAEDVFIHSDQIERYGGEPGLRDRGLLESAVATPQATFGGDLLHTDLAEIAAAYLFHLASNRPFVDGNKRTATAAALVFLEINGCSMDIPDEELFGFVIRLADGRVRKPEVADFLRRWMPS